MTSRYLNKFSNQKHSASDEQIKAHLEKAKRELVSALKIIARNRRTNILYRVASRKTEIEMKGILTLIDRVSVIKPLQEQEKDLTPKEKRALRRNGGTVKSTSGVKNVRQKRR